MGQTVEGVKKGRRAPSLVQILKKSEISLSTWILLSRLNSEFDVERQL